MVSSRKKRPLDRRVSRHRDSRLVIVATEGSKKEKRYFSIFRSSRLQIKVIESIDGRSSPNHIMQNLKLFVESYDLGASDQCFLAIDKDRWTNKRIGEIAQLCHQRQFQLALSNPCFEAWLALHFPDELPNDGRCSVFKAHVHDIIKALNAGNDLTLYKERVADAIERAIQMDQNPTDRWPQSIGTHVYKIAELFK